MRYLVKIIETESGMMVAGLVGGKTGELLFNGYKGLVLQDERSYEDGWW